MQSQTAQIYEQDSKLYLETFLIDVTKTKKGKKVNEKSIDSNVNASKQHPLTLYPRKQGENWIWDHPVIETNSLSQNIEFQKQYEIGQAVRVKKIRDGYWNAVYEITDSGAKNLFKQYLDKTIPFWTSSGIIHSNQEDPLDIKDWRIIHNAIVSEPANGFEKAAVVDICAGTESTCSAILTASINKPSFCTATSLENYISSLSTASGISPHYTMSSESTNAQIGSPNLGFSSTNAQTGQGSIPTNLTPPTPNNTEKVEQQQQKPEVKESIDYKAKVKELEDQLKTISKEKETKDLENKTVTERLASLERENIRNNRKNQVLALAQGYPEAFMNPKTGAIDQASYSKTVLEYIDKGFDDATIKELLDAKTLKFANQLDKDGNCINCNSTTTAEHQTTTMTTASMPAADLDSSLPIWEKIRDLTNANIRLSAEKYQKIGGKSY